MSKFDFIDIGSHLRIGRDLMDTTMRTIQKVAIASTIAFSTLAFFPATASTAQAGPIVPLGHYCLSYDLGGRLQFHKLCTMSGHRVGTRRRMLRQDRSRRRARPPMGRRPRALPAVSERRHNSFNRAGPGKQSPPCTPAPAGSSSRNIQHHDDGDEAEAAGPAAPPPSPGPARRGVRISLVAKSTPPRASGGQARWGRSADACLAIK